MSNNNQYQKGEMYYTKGEVAIAIALATGNLNNLGFFFNKIEELVESGKLQLYKKGSYCRFSVSNVNEFTKAEAQKRLETISRFLNA